MHFLDVIKGLRLYKVNTWGADSGNMADGTDRERTTNIREADVLSSLVDSTDSNNVIDINDWNRPVRMHKLVIDIDHETTLIDSSTPGHHHLIVNHEIPEHKYFNLISALADAGIIEQGYATVSIDLRKETQVRLPWIHK